MKRKVIRNTLVLLFSRFGSRLLVFFFAIYLARTLGVVDFGKLVFVTSFVSTFFPLADFGMENFLLKEVSRQIGKRVQILRNLFFPRVVLGFVVYFLIILLAFAAGYSDEDLVNIGLFGLTVLPYSLNYFFLAYFNAQEKVVKSGLFKISFPLLYVFLGFAFLRLGFSYRWVLLGSVVANSVSALIMLFFYPQILKKIEFSWTRFRQVVKKTWPFAILIFIAVFYLRVDVMILKKMAGSRATGLYGPVNSLIMMAILIPQSFTLALFPISSRLVARNKKKMKRIYVRGIWSLFLASLPLVLLGFWLTPVLTPLLFGDKYLESIPALRVAFLSLTLFFVNALPGNVIFNSRKVKGFIPLALSNFGVNVALNFLLIPHFSFVGSAWAKLGSEVFGLIVNNLYVYKILHEKS